MTRFARVLFALVACWFWSCSSGERPSQPAPASAPGAVNTRVAVATFPATGTLSFALAPGTCAGNSCPAVVQLRRDGNVIDSAPLDFAASSSELKTASADKMMGAGDPLDRGSLPAWTAGSGENTVSTAARSVKLSSEEAGLLVDQSGGFEHVKRRHYLFAVVGDKLKRVWTGEEGAGPAWSATVLADAAGGSGQDILYLTGFQPGGAEPDTVDAKRYRWDPAQKTVTETSDVPLYGVVAGNFASAEAARAAQAQSCLSDYSALRAGDLGLPGSRVVLAAITTRKSLADAAVQKTDNCPAGMTRRSVEVKLPAAKR